MIFNDVKINLKQPGIIIFLTSLVMIVLSGCYLENCCTDYAPEFTTDSTEKTGFEQMCYNSMNFDGKYDSGDACYLKEVDRYIEAAVNCCAPLKDKLEYQYCDKSDLESSSLLDSLFISFALSVIPGCDDLGCYGVLVPTNAYTYCLYNTHPRTYLCDIDAAKKFATDITQCCSNASPQYECILSYFKNGESCPKVCCEGLPDQDNDQYISKDNCLKVLNSSNECIETPVDACCRIAPKDPARGHIDRSICKQIYAESKGQCVNTDEKYEIYKNQSE